SPLFLDAHGHHRDLHSFPTRRSSDLSGFAAAMWAEELILNWRDNHLEFSAPRVHFLTGKPLDRLRNAEPVPFDLQITLWSGNRRDRKSTRLNSSHVSISYAVFCLKKK